ncbi:unnamed protein product [Hermetia illucens]|uniref:RING-type domain-containing protein n=1 Tax=Hermetia illucens TaxID=343691 RepID=A0A7R8UJY2_HERIL|nr:death-associated inhibitor of apoptosis 1-like [Hermetia illucens]XP_037908577.1 death-associated inhibitor of apoptosis 1-like [Hermetia illucens]CAD7082243.1 unnamed protein product [Hermetia illucens]
MPPLEKYNSELERLKSFQSGWHMEKYDCQLLACMGMYYTGVGESVQCQFCNVRIDRFEEDEGLVETHMAYSDGCPLLECEFTPNVPLDFLSLHFLLPGELDSIACEEFILESDRLASFSKVQGALVTKANELAEAGFFYMTDGSLMCFCCGGTLDGVLPEEDPWQLHGILYNHCRYLRLMRGRSRKEDDDVNQSQEKILHPTAPQLEELDLQEAKSIATHDHVAQRELENDNELERDGVAAEGAVALPTEHKPHERESSVNESNDDSITISKSLFQFFIKGGNEDTGECKICSEQIRDVVFLPCGHVVACSECAKQCEFCPICRAKVERKHKLYYS